MRRIELSVLALFFASALCAQETPAPTWTRQGVAGVNLSQVSLSNWSAGGDNSSAGDAYLSYSLDYKKGKSIWQDRLELAYGTNWTESNGNRKTNDKIYFNSLYGYQIAPKWYLSAFVNFQTQFAKGFDYSASTTDYISRFMSPGYLSAGPGITWIPNSWFNANFSPATWRGTFVLDETLSDRGAFGVDPGKHLRNEFGANLKLEARYEFLPNMMLYSRLDLFSNYLEKPQNVDVRWDTQITMKINDWFSANLNLNLIYDDDTKFAVDGGREVAKLQFKETLGIGFQVQF